MIRGAPAITVLVVVEQCLRNLVRDYLEHEGLTVRFYLLGICPNL
jgi:hypothetical protein